MTIETRFNLGDTVWVIWDFKPRQCVVADLRINVGANGMILITYSLNNGLLYKTYPQDLVYANKEDLQNALFGGHS